MSRTVGRLSLAAVAIVVGILLVGQLRSQAPRLELTDLSARELSELIATLETRNAQLAGSLSEVRGRIEVYEQQDLAGTLVATAEDIVRLSAFAGQLPVEGQGIVMEIEGRFEPTHVTDIIHELRGAGAEAIAIDDVRITGLSVPVLGTAEIEIDGVGIGDAFTVTAIGSPDGLAGALERPGGILQLLEQEIAATWAIDIVDAQPFVRVPATDRDLAPQVAQPVE